MHKVYCKNCKYYERREVGKFADEDTIFDRCLKLSKVFRDSIGDLCITDITDCNVQNEDKNCKYYERKWWKFWIKNWCSIGELPKVSFTPPTPKCKKPKGT